MNIFLQRIMVGFFFIFCLSSVTEAADSTFHILLVENGRTVWVERQLPEENTQARTTRSRLTDDDIAERLKNVLSIQMAGPTEGEASKGVVSLFPANSKIDEIKISNGQAIIKFTFPSGYLDNFNEAELQFISVSFNRLIDYVDGLNSIKAIARSSEFEDYQSLHKFLPPAPPPIRKHEGKSSKLDSPTRLVRAGQSPRFGQPQPEGALSGASIFLSPGHGWYCKDWNSQTKQCNASNQWGLQKTLTYNIQEDHSNAEAVFQYLVQYLWNAGARVYPVRERDLNTNIAIVDNTNPNYSETGAWVDGELTNSTTEEINRLPRSYESSFRYTDQPNAAAIFTPDIPEDGYYGVYVWYPTKINNPRNLDEELDISTSTKINITHTGGTSSWFQNQNQDGNTWKYVGTYYFHKGSNSDIGSVTISKSNENTGFVIADAVRFGGGAGISGYPRWEEAGYYYSGFMGKIDWDSASVHDINGRTPALPRYAEWEQEDWEYNRSIYVSWHTNAGNGTGTETYVYSSDVTGASSDYNEESGNLRDAIHDELLNDIRSGADENWNDHGKQVLPFIELNPDYLNNGNIPATLIELAYHDTQNDAVKIKDPDFRLLAARAVYQGIVKFYANHKEDFNNSTLLPEPPTNFRAVNNGTGSVTLSWNQPPYNPTDGNGLLGDEATGYRIYSSINGKGFDNGIATNNTTAEVSVFNGENLEIGRTYYFRITATNTGGESFPTETLAVRIKESGNASILVVNGFDRIDGHANIMEGDVARGYLSRMNTYDYIIQHAVALDEHRRNFDSCSNEAVMDHQVTLSDYDTVIWILGEESSVDHTFDANERMLVKSFLDQGGNLFVSGSEIGNELQGGGVDADFYNNDLHANYIADKACGANEDCYLAKGEEGTIFWNIPEIVFDNGYSIYNVDSPDRIDSNSGSTVNIRYQSPGSGGAGIEYIGGDPERRLVMLSFPFETIVDESVRNMVMANSIDFFSPIKFKFIGTSENSRDTRDGDMKIIKNGGTPEIPDMLTIKIGDEEVQRSWDSSSDEIAFNIFNDFSYRKDSDSQSSSGRLLIEPVLIEVYDGNKKLLDTYYPFRDVKPNEYYSKPVVLLWKKGIVTGYGDGLLGRKNEISRQEFLKIVLLASSDHPNSDSEYETLGYKGSDSFSDVPATVNVDNIDVVNWADKFIGYATQYHTLDNTYFDENDTDNGIVKGSGSKFSPNNSITRAEAAKILVRTQQSLYQEYWDKYATTLDTDSSNDWREDNAYQFLDVTNSNVADNDGWFYYYVYTLGRRVIKDENGNPQRKSGANYIVNGYLDGNYGWGNFILRQEAAKMICYATFGEDQCNQGN